MKHCFYSLFAALGMGLVLLSQTSCKEDTILDASVVPQGDTVSTMKLPDTLTIQTRTYFDDSTPTSVSYIFPTLGTITPGADPWSGKVYGSIYLQLVPPTFGFSFPEEPDSAYLILPYSGFTYGDTTAANIPQTFRIYEIDDTMSRDVVYYSSTQKNVNRSKVLGEATVTYQQLRDSVSDLGSKRAPHLRIRITDQDFLSKIRNSPTTGNAPDFISYFKGLYIEPKDTNSGNALHYFRMDGTGDYGRANLLFYYTGKNANDEDTVRTASFHFNPTYTAYYNRVTRNFAGTPIEALIANNIDTIIAIQNEPGASLDLKIPYLKHLPKTPINKAELVITQFRIAGDPNEALYRSPERIYPNGIDANGEVYTILDRFPINRNEPLQFIGGHRKVVTIGGIEVMQYVLNIPREVQRAVVEERDILHLRISGTVQYPGAFRFIGAGRSHSNSMLHVKMNIVYSKI